MTSPASLVGVSVPILPTIIYKKNPKKRKEKRIIQKEVPDDIKKMRVEDSNKLIKTKTRTLPHIKQGQRQVLLSNTLTLLRNWEPLDSTKRTFQQ